MIIKVHKPTLRRSDMMAVLQTMANEQIGPGDHTTLFTKKISEQVVPQYSHAIALRSIADALIAALSSLGMREGAHVGISVLSPKFYQEILYRERMKPVVFDIDFESGILDLDAVKKVEHTLDAIILFEPGGSFPIDPRWKELSIPIIEDISESMGSVYAEDSAGVFGKVIICALEESSLVSTGGGAVVICKDDDVGKRLDSSISPLLPYMLLPDMNAALGIVQLQQLEHNLAKRRYLCTRYRQALMRTSHRMFGIQDIDFAGSGHSFTVVLDSRPQDVIQFALKHEVGTERVFYHSDLEDSLHAYPNATSCILRSLRFPVYPFLAASEIQQIERVLSHLP